LKEAEMITAVKARIFSYIVIAVIIGLVFSIAIKGASSAKRSLTEKTTPLFTILNEVESGKY
jgi:uncharacterized membrane protein YraQ (UPF0718 family)